MKRLNTEHLDKKNFLDPPTYGHEIEFKRDVAGKKLAWYPPIYINELLTADVCQIIFRHLEDSRDIGKARCTCRGFNEAGKNVASLRWVCRDIDHELARKSRTCLKSLDEDNGETSEIDQSINQSDISQQPLEDICDASDGRGHPSTLENMENQVQFSSIGRRNGNQCRRSLNGEYGEHEFQGSSYHGKLSVETDSSRCTSHRTSKYMNVADRNHNSSLVSNPVPEASTGKQNILKGKFHVGGGNESSRTKQQGHMLFREAVEQDLRAKPYIQQLRIEIEPKLQSKSVNVDEREWTDHWLSEPLHLENWVPYVGVTLQHLCIVDYGRQAILHNSTILTILSQHCKRLKTIDLRNMFIDTRGCIEFTELTSFTLRCVKLNAKALDDISEKMKGLQTLALLGVFGVEGGHLSSPQLKVLCLGLSRKAKSVKIDLPNLSKLQLKMACPDELSITAPALKFIAFNLEVRNCSAIEFHDICNLQELLYGASNFFALSKLVKDNWFMNKVFLDIPCMALGEDGKWLGVLKDVTLNLPSFKILQLECPNLEILNIGPGLWHSMECNKQSVMDVEKWPPVKTLILHMIPKTLEICVDLVKMFQKKLQASLVNLEISVHTTSPVTCNDFFEAIKDEVKHVNFKPKQWTKSLDFSCFTF